MSFAIIVKSQSQYFVGDFSVRLISVFVVWNISIRIETSWWLKLWAFSANWGAEGEVALLMRVVKFFVIFPMPVFESREPGASYRSRFELNRCWSEIVVRGTDAIATLWRDFENMKKRRSFVNSGDVNYRTVRSWEREGFHIYNTACLNTGDAIMSIGQAAVDHRATYENQWNGSKLCRWSQHVFGMVQTTDCRSMTEI
jgi:hypothetical protein